MLAAPPLGGLLYDHLGFRAPFIFAIALTAVDFVGRLLVIERRDALKWGYDPAAPQGTTHEEGNSTPHKSHRNAEHESSRSIAGR